MSDIGRGNQSTVDCEEGSFLQYFLRRSSSSDEASPHEQVSNELSLEFFDPDEDFFPGVRIAKEIYVEKNPDTSLIVNSDIDLNIKSKIGALNNKAYSSNELPPICSLLKMRESGLKRTKNFTFGDKCQIFQNYLPNELQTIDRFNCKVFCGTYSLDGNRFLTAAQDFYIRVYNAHTSNFKMTKIVEARDVGWSILDTAFSPNGVHFVYCSWSEFIHLCHVSDDVELHESMSLCPDQDRFCIFSLRFSQDGNEVLCATNDECFYIYNIERNQRTLKVHGHMEDVNSAAFTDNSSQILLSVGDDTLCKIWDRRALSENDPKPVGIFTGHEEGITYVDPKDDGRYLITNSKDQTIKLWDMRKSCPNSSLQPPCKTMQSYNWDYRWQRVPYRLSKAKKKLPHDSSLMTYRGHTVLQTLIRCRFSPEVTTGQQYIYTGCSMGPVVIYDLLTGKIKAKLSSHKSCVRDVSWHPYRNEIISSSWDGSLGQWTYHGKEPLDSNSKLSHQEEQKTLGLSNSDKSKKRRSQRTNQRR